MKCFKLFLLCCSFSISSLAAETPTIRLGVQATGTLAWELLLLEANDRTITSGFKIEPLSLANSEAGKIALQSGTVDMIVSDWIWVSRMRSEGSDFTFVPYSTISGSLMVPGNSPIKSLAGLKGKKLGIAGGELDKNWLLLQALAQRENIDLNANVDKVFGAPPLINEQLKQGRVDAALNYWHFGAKLETQGFRQLLDGKSIVKSLGIQESVPVLGYVFKQSWADKHKTGLNSFFQAGKEAKQRLCTSDADWKKVLPLTQTDAVAEQNKLRQRYCEGAVSAWGKPEQQAAERIYGLLRAVSDNQLTGKSAHVQPGTFWTPN